ncbi:MAG: hypothetical protein OXF01_11915 [Gemmatimonadetes bacterium]|nr:hypothetical protein [Gemmatimonadota bacterium]
MCLFCIAGLIGAEPGREPEPSRGSPDDPLVPDSVLTIPSGPTLILERTAGIPVVGIRVSAPLDPPWPGAARILVEQALDRARGRAEAIGAELWGGVQDGRIAFHAIADVRYADELAWVVRLLIAEPEAIGASGATARARARLDQLAETPRGRLVLEMEGRVLGVGGGALPVPGVDEVRDMWRRSHARDRLRILVLGDLPLHWVFADLSRIGAPPGPQAGAPIMPPPQPLPFPESPLYTWSAAAFSLGPAHDPAVLTAVAALRVGLLRSEIPNAAVNLVEGPDDRSAWLGVTARAPRSRDADGALASALALMTAEGLDAWWMQGAATARSDFIAAASTPAGWLALSDRYHAPDGGTNARTALDRFTTLRRQDLTPVLEQFQATLFRPGIDR